MQKKGWCEKNQQIKWSLTTNVHDKNKEIILKQLPFQTKVVKYRLTIAIMALFHCMVRYGSARLGTVRYGSVRVGLHFHRSLVPL